MTIKPDVRAKVIEMAREGKGRNEIAHELGLANIRISSGSVSNILKAAFTPTSAPTPNSTPLFNNLCAGRPWERTVQ